MSIKINFKTVSFAFIAALFVILGNASFANAQDGNMYEEPWHPAARFAVKEGSKKEKATIKLVKVSNANFTTGETGLDFNICMEVIVKKGSKKATKQYAQTNVFRDDKTMVYTMKNWLLSKTPPELCQ